MRSVLLCFFVLLSQFLVAPLYGVEMTISNPSFDHTSLSNGRITRTVLNWSVTGGTTNSDVGVFNPRNEYNSGVSGDNVLYMVTNTRGKRNNVVQQTGTNMTPGVTYTLKVDVGHRLRGSRRNFSGYQVALLCGNRVVRATSNLTAPGARGTFGEVTVSYEAKAGDTGLIGIQFGSGTNSGPGAAVDFDNVRLSTDEVAASREITWSGRNVTRPNHRHVQDPSFERTRLDNGRSYKTFWNWNVRGNTNNSDIAIYNPTNEYSRGVSGNNILYMVSNTPGRRHNLVQHLTTRMTPGQTYRLTVDVGQRAAGSRQEFAGYQISLLSGNRVVRQVGNLTPPSGTPGTFGTVVLEYVARASDTGAVGIQIGSGTNAGPGAAVDFDNVTLTINGTSFGGSPGAVAQQVAYTGTPNVALRTTGNSVLNVNLTDRQVVQRSLNGSYTEVPFEGRCHPSARRIQILVTNRANNRRSGWVDIAMARGGRYSGTYDLQPGWYQVRMRALNASNRQIRAITVNRLGVGDVFICAGQSNSANFGQTRHTANYDSVSWCNVTNGTWSHATDMPGNPSASPAAAGRGSYWPILGDYIAQNKRIPSAFAVVGDGGSSVRSWNPNIRPLDNYPNLHTAISLVNPTGFRAILWHQGEAEIGRRTPNANYVRDLQTVINQTRLDAGWEVPWYVSRVHMVTAQNEVIASDRNVFAGPATDSLTMGRGMRYDRVHFSSRALPVVADMWFRSVYGNASTGRGNGSIAQIGGSATFGGSAGTGGGSNQGGGSVIPISTQSSTPGEITFKQPVLRIGYADEDYSFTLETEGGTGASPTWQVWRGGDELQADADGYFTIVSGIKCKPVAGRKLRFSGKYNSTEEDLRSYRSTPILRFFKLKITDQNGNVGEKQFFIIIRFRDVYDSTNIGIAYLWNRATRNEAGSNGNLVAEVYQGWPKTQEVFERAGVTPEIKVFGYTTDYGAGTGTPAASIFDDMIKIWAGEEGEDIEFRRLTYDGSGVIGHAYYSAPVLRSTFGCNQAQFVFDRNATRNFGSEPRGLAGWRDYWFGFSIVDYKMIDENIAAHELAHNYGCVHEERWKVNDRNFSVMRSTWNKDYIKNYLSDKNWYQSSSGWMGDDNQSNIDHVYWYKYLMSTNLD